MDVHLYPVSIDHSCNHFSPVVHHTYPISDKCVAIDSSQQLYPRPVVALLINRPSQTWPLSEFKEAAEHSHPWYSGLSTHVSTILDTK